MGRTDAVHGVAESDTTVTELNCTKSLLLE